MSKLKLNIDHVDRRLRRRPGRNPPEHPLGIGGEELHQWLYPLAAFRGGHGEEGGEVNASTPFAEEILGGAGATIMGRNMFGGGPGPWTSRGKAGGETIRPSTIPFSSSRTIRASYWRCRAERCSTSSPPGSSRRSNKRGQQPERRTCHLAAAHRSCSSTSQRACSTRSSYRSSRSCSVAALGCSKTWEMPARTGRVGRCARGDSHQVHPGVAARWVALAPSSAEILSAGEADFDV